MTKHKERIIKEIMTRIDEIPVVSVDQIIQEKGLLFRLRREWLKSVAETIYSLITTAEKRGEAKKGEAKRIAYQEGFKQGEQRSREESKPACVCECRYCKCCVNKNQ